MKLSHRILAALTLLVWLFAFEHVAERHGGDGSIVGLHTNAVAHADEGEHSPDGEGEHEHDISNADRGAWVPGAGGAEAPAPDLQPLFAAFTQALALLAREAAPPLPTARALDSPPDGRASGWLMVVQTALPVRGPSLS